jgi:hypothetical protein
MNPLSPHISSTGQYVPESNIVSADAVSLTVQTSHRAWKSHFQLYGLADELRFIPPLITRLTDTPLCDGEAHTTVATSICRTTLLELRATLQRQGLARVSSIFSLFCLSHRIFPLSIPYCMCSHALLFLVSCTLSSHHARHSSYLFHYSFSPNKTNTGPDSTNAGTEHQCRDDTRIIQSGFRSAASLPTGPPYRITPLGVLKDRVVSAIAIWIPKCSFYRLRACFIFGSRPCTSSPRHLRERLLPSKTTLKAALYERDR